MITSTPQGPVGTTGLPQGRMMLQQGAAPQPVFVLSHGGMAQHVSAPQLNPGVGSAASLQQVPAQPPAHDQGHAGSIDVSTLKAVLQDVLRSLPASSASTSAGDQQQLQGPGDVLGMPQTASSAQFVQPQPSQQVYVTSGQQVLLVDQGPPMMLQEGAAYAYNANAGSSAQLAPVFVSEYGVLGDIANSQHSFASTAACQGAQTAPAGLNAEVPQTAAGQFMLSSNASSTLAQLADFNTNINSSMQAIAAVGAGRPGSATVMVNQAWHNSVSLPGSSSAVSQQQVLLGPPAYGPVVPQVAQQQLSSIGFDVGVSGGYGNAPAVSEATLAQTSWGPVPAASAPGLVQGTSPAPAEGGAAIKLPVPWANTPLGGDLQHLWGNQQLLEAKGGLIYNSTERSAWPPPAVAKVSAQDLYDFRRLKHAVHSLDTVTKMRKRLVKRLHAVVDFGGGELKSVYFEVRCAISEVMQSADAQRLNGAHLRGLVRLALDLQEALWLGPGAVATASAE